MTTVNAYQNVSMNISSFDDFLTLVNNSGAGYLFTAIDVLVFLVLLITLSGAFGWEAGFLTAGFVGIILSLLFSYMGVMSWWLTGFFVGIILVIISYIIWSNRND